MAAVVGAHQLACEPEQRRLGHRVVVGLQQRQYLAQPMDVLAQPLQVIGQADRDAVARGILADALHNALALLQQHQDARAERAATQGFTFCADKDSGRLFFWCWSHTSGEVYEVTPQSCNCPDHEFRCKANGLKCKHRIALQAALVADEVRSW